LAEDGLHRSLLAYVSDFHLVATATLPHGVHFAEGNVQLATLDHAMWFHQPFRIDEWLLYSMESPSASGGRGFALGQLFSQDGRLVASTAQEGVVRVWR
jgi:acyl-CoA thioesterase-2